MTTDAHDVAEPGRGHEGHAVPLALQVTQLAGDPLTLVLPEYGPELRGDPPKQLTIALPIRNDMVHFSVYQRVVITGEFFL